MLYLPAMDALHTLLAGAIDYAGLFPPARLSMNESAREYSAYRRSPDSWALGRFVVPANRLDELASLRAAEPDESVEAWPLSVLAGPHLADDLARIGSLDARRLRVEALEIRADDAAEIAAVAAATHRGVERYLEIPLDADVESLVQAIVRAELGAKMRTGGVTADSFPPAASVIRFLAACITSDVPFKATAGLHHALRGSYRLTYEPGSASAPMYGFLNVFAAAAALRAGGSRDEATSALMEESPDVLRLDETGLHWRGRDFDADSLSALRRTGMTSFGSCSFREPLDELAGARAS